MSNKKRAAIIALASLGLLGGGLAMASWTASGTGTGSATADTARELQVTVGNVSGLYPTGSVDVPFTVKNTNPYHVTLDNAHLQSVTSSQAGCEEYVTGVDLPLTDRIQSGDSRSYNFPVTMSKDSVDACQGASFTVTLKVTGASS